MASAYYVVEVPSYEGSDTSRTQWSAVEDGRNDATLYCIVKVADGTAAVVDDGYRTVDEAQKAWPEAR